MFTNTWHWWLAPNNHRKACALTMAFEIYKMFAKGLVKADWKIEDITDIPEVRNTVGKQTCKYQAKNLAYLVMSISVMSLTLKGRKGFLHWTV